MLEAMAIGLPTICTDCAGGGAREIIEDGVNGFLIEENSASLAVLLTKVCMDFALSEHLFEGGRTNQNMLRTVGKNQKLLFR